LVLCIYLLCKKIDSIIVAVAIMGERRTGMSRVEGKWKRPGHTLGQCYSRESCEADGLEPSAEGGI
jgi:hypothetical protein